MILPLSAYDLFLPEPLGHLGFFGVKPFRELEGIVEKKKAPKEAVVVKKKGTEDNLASFEKGTCYSLDFLKFGIIEGHSDVYKPEVCELFWRAIQLELPPEYYKPTDPATLLKNYWTDVNVRLEKPSSGRWRKCTLC